jgi:hypothetical protein
VLPRRAHSCWRHRFLGLFGVVFSPPATKTTTTTSARVRNACGVDCGAVDDDELGDHLQAQGREESLRTGTHARGYIDVATPRHEALGGNRAVQVARECWGAVVETVGADGFLRLGREGRSGWKLWRRERQRLSLARRPRMARI